jgi:hypothetical protein
VSQALVVVSGMADSLMGSVFLGEGELFLQFLTVSLVQRFFVPSGRQFFRFLALQESFGQGAEMPVMLAGFFNPGFASILS